MLAEARKNNQDIANITFCEMDMEQIDFPDRHFDAAVTAFGIFFVKDMKKQLNHIADKVKDGGTILMSTFSANSFTPLAHLFTRRLEQYGVEIPNPAWRRVATRALCTDLFKGAGITQVQSEKIASGYYLNDVSDWWHIIENGGFRGMADQLPDDKKAQFKKEHLAEVAALKTEKGIWLEMGILYTVGKK